MKRLLMACDADLCAVSSKAQQARKTITIKQAFEIYEQHQQEKDLSYVGTCRELGASEL